MNNYINEMFGMKFNMTKISAPKNLPIYMHIGRTFYLLADNNNKMILIEIKENEKFGVIAYEKQMNLYLEYFQLPVAFWFENVTKTQRDSLIDKKIPFISENQLYLPYFGIVFNNRFKQSKIINVEKMMPITQSLFIYLLIVLKGKKVIKKEAAKYLNVTKTSLTRASEQLLKMELIKQEKIGREYYIWIEENSYNTFLQAKSYLINPIQESILVETSKEILNLPISSESALSKRSMLAEPRVKSVAQFKNIKHQWTVLDEKWDYDKDMIRVELWKYNPELFMKDGIVDPISLYMSLKETIDERIESELEKMMEEYEW